jgi:SOS-response transcriptional repressor LexA
VKSSGRSLRNRSCNKDLSPDKASHQFRLLKAIAAGDGVAQPTAGSFISGNDLTSASSVSASLKALADKEMIVYDRERWHVYDVFFSRWPEYYYSEGRGQGV